MGVISAESADPALSEQPLAAPFSSLVESATLEFHAALQLLAERARFLTAAEGVAVAVGAGRDFTYMASVGASVPAIDDIADAVSGTVGEAISKMQPLAAAAAASFVLVAPIKRQQKIAGFFLLVSGRAGFGEQEVNSVARLSDLAATALELHESAEHAAARIFEGQKKSQPAQRPVWHAPATGSEQTAVASSSPIAATEALAEKCWWCGFPVSPGRKLCVDCEEKNLASVSHEEKPLFQMEEEESWISRHGYTIASVLVSALAGVIIYLLR